MSQAERRSTTSAHTVEALLEQATLFTHQLDALDAARSTLTHGLVLALRGAEDAAIEQKANTVAGMVFQLQVIGRLGEDLLQCAAPCPETRRRAELIIGQIYRAVDAVIGKARELPQAA